MIPITTIATFPKRWLLTLLMGAVLSLVCAYAGDLLTPPALARWTIQINDNEDLRAAFAMVGVRHLPIFLIAIALGNLMFTAVKSTSISTVGLAALPYLIYVVGTAVHDSLDAAEPAFSWMAYEPGYFIWPHFIALPLGLLAAGRMVKRRIGLVRR